MLKEKKDNDMVLHHFIKLGEKTDLCLLIGPDNAYVPLLSPMKYIHGSIFFTQDKLIKVG